MRSVHSKHTLLERVLDAYRNGDLEECIRRVRTLVEAAPMATAPRQLLASVYAQAGNQRLALAHYRKLLPAAISRGEVFVALAIQKQIDSLEPPESHAPDRWSRLQSRLRESGRANDAAVPGGIGRPWSTGQLLALPRVWFERVAYETRVELLGLEVQTFDVEAGLVWELIAGRMRWSFALPDGRASAEAIAAEGDTIHVDPDLARRVRVTICPELPVECLCFHPTLARELLAALAALGSIPGTTGDGFTSEARAFLPTRPRPQEDLDIRRAVPETPAGSEPPRLALPKESGPPAQAKPRDTGAWVDFGVISFDEGASTARVERDLPTSPDADVPTESRRRRRGDVHRPLETTRGDVDASAPPPSSLPPAGLPNERMIDLTGSDDRAATPLPPASVKRERLVDLPGPGSRPPSKRGHPVVQPPGAIEMGHGLIIPPGSDPFAEPIPDLGKPIERRRHPRVGVSFDSNLALLRMGPSRVAPIHGQLFDLSTSGLGLRFDQGAPGFSRAALEDAVMAVELDLPGSAGPLRVAGQVRWLEVDDDGGEARIGIEFVLMTEPDRRRIAGTLASSPAAREAARQKR
jgi:PilZ domain-containing protein